MQERRNSKRYKRALAVRYSCAKGPLIIESESKSKDICAKGICLPVEDTLEVSDRIRLAITLPWRKQPLDAIGKVVWASPRLITSDLTIRRSCGLEFLWLSAENFEEIIKHSRS